MDAARVVEISAISADDLENVRKLGRKMHTFAIVTADGDLSQRVSTGVDEEGGCNPVWNDKLQLSVRGSLNVAFNMNMNIQVVCKTALGGQRSVGWSRVPLSDIFNGFGHPHSLNCLSYRLKNNQGRPHGTINFSLRFLQQHVINYPPHFSATLPQQGRLSSGVTMGSYPVFSSPSPYDNDNATPNANYQLHPNIPVLSVYPPLHHNQMYA